MYVCINVHLGTVLLHVMVCNHSDLVVQSLGIYVMGLGENRGFPEIWHTHTLTSQDPLQETMSSASTLFEHFVQNMALQLYQPHMYMITCTFHLLVYNNNHMLRMYTVLLS